jgi:hypothetical protein
MKKTARKKGPKEQATASLVLALGEIVREQL